MPRPRMGNQDYGVRVIVEGEDEVAQLQTRFNAMAARLESALLDLKTERDRVAQLLAGRQELIATVSHELRTPVATVRAVLGIRRDPTQGRSCRPRSAAIFAWRTTRCCDCRA